MPDAFSQAYSRYMKEIRMAIASNASHDQRRHLFTNFLQAAYPLLNTWAVQLEKYVSGLGLRGYIDFLFEDIIIEFKRDIERERAVGLKELTKYIALQDHSDKIIGLLTDGRSFEAYRMQSGELALFDNFLLDEEREEDARRSFDAYIFASDNIRPTSEDIVRRFGDSSPVYAVASAQLNDLYQEVENSAAVKTKFDEWDNLLSHVYGSKVGSADLFVRHTYLVMLTRLLAYEVLTGAVPSRGIEGVVDGTAFRPIGIENLVESDFFAWVCDDAVVARTREILQALSAHLAVYDFDLLNEDVLKELYQNLVDPTTRHELGEFYTPDWLAELTLEKAEFGPKISLIDPACGSGTFLFVAVRILRKSITGAALVQHVFENFAGVDVHPVAVIVAKINLILALMVEMRDGGITVLPPMPIYMADSLRLPAKATGGKKKGAQVDGVSIPVSPEPKERRPKNVPEAFIIPRTTAAKPEKLDMIIGRMTELALAPRGADNSALLDAFTEIVEPLDKSNVSLWRGNFRLLRWLIDRPNPRDSVWAFILRNAYRPAYFAERKFDLVAGNPPWLTHHEIKRKEYKEEVETLVRRYGLSDMSARWHFAQMEIATTFFAHCFERYVKPNGQIAFVMTRSVLTGARQHAEFQNRYAADLILDLENVEPLFGVPACALLKTKGGH